MNCLWCFESVKHCSKCTIKGIKKGMTNFGGVVNIDQIVN